MDVQEYTLFHLIEDSTKKKNFFNWPKDEFVVPRLLRNPYCALSFMSTIYASLLYKTLNWALNFILSITWVSKRLTVMVLTNFSPSVLKDILSFSTSASKISVFDCWWFPLTSLTYKRKINSAVFLASFLVIKVNFSRDKIFLFAKSIIFSLNLLDVYFSLELSLYFFWHFFVSGISC